MKYISTHIARIKDCKLILKNVDKWRSTLMNLDGQEVRISIDKNIDLRSTQQNRFYWLYLQVIEDETGENADDLHEYFKRKFLPPRFIKIFGKEIKLPATTTKLDKLEFTNYLEKICAESGIPIPNYDI